MTLSPGSPFICSSTGAVINRSTSSAAWPGHWVMISTIGGDRSGYASTGSRLNDHSPIPTIASAPSITSSRWRSDAATTRFTSDGLRVASASACVTSCSHRPDRIPLGVPRTP